MNILLELLRNSNTLRRITFRILKIFLSFYKEFLTRKYFKRKSSEILISDVLPRSGVTLGILSGLGISKKELGRKPFIAVVNSFCELNPGHAHLRELAEEVKKGIIDAGALPFEVNVPAPCDGMANGTIAMRYILPQRDLIADSIEMYIKSQFFDGMVCLCSCDKINPGMLMAALRINIPTIFLTGGPNRMRIREKEFFKNSINPDDYKRLKEKIECATTTGYGACELLTTANTFQILIEGMGLALPYSSTSPANSQEKFSFAYKTGKRIVELVKGDLKPRDIVNYEAIKNAVILSQAICASTNVCLHLPAIAREIGIDLDLEIFNKYKNIPVICGMAPSGPYGVSDLHFAGGVPAVILQLKDDLNLDSLNVSGEKLRDIIKNAPVINNDVIRTKDFPFYPEGAITILKGNIAENGAVVKQSAVKKEKLKFTGPARIYEGEKDALRGIIRGDVKNGDVVVIRYEGPKGAPGMPELLSVTLLLELFNLDVALLTDGRFSGATSGPCIGHISPEAYEGGLIALLKDGDIIEIDIPERKLNAKIQDEEISKRKKEWKRIEKEVEFGYLKRYREMVSGADKGAILK
jgi:dihydroxy-acid dehydratase